MQITPDFIDKHLNKPCRFRFYPDFIENCPFEFLSLGIKENEMNKTPDFFNYLSTITPEFVAKCRKRMDARKRNSLREFEFNEYKNLFLKRNSCF